MQRHSYAALMPEIRKFSRDESYSRYLNIFESASYISFRPYLGQVFKSLSATCAPSAQYLSLPAYRRRNTLQLRYLLFTSTLLIARASHVIRVRALRDATAA